MFCFSGNIFVDGASGFFVCLFVCFSFPEMFLFVVLLLSDPAFFVVVLLLRIFFLFFLLFFFVFFCSYYFFLLLFHKCFLLIVFLFCFFPRSVTVCSVVVFPEDFCSWF